MTQVSSVTQPRKTKDERIADGRAARSRVPRSKHAAWEPPSSRADPVTILEEQAATRIQSLVPIRYARMAASPFAFYRGAAAIMAADLATTPQTGIIAQLCGDAHLANFGGFASPERDLLFDINDFDETNPGPWEWDLKRLAASFAVSGRERGFGEADRAQFAVNAARAYREAMRKFAGMSNLDVWYARLNADAMLARWKKDGRKQDVKLLKRAVVKAQSKDRLRAFDKLTHIVDGEPRIISDPPLIIPIEEVVGDVDAAALQTGMEQIVEAYGESLQNNRRHLLRDYRVVHAASKVVGVGSVGTAAWIALLIGLDNNDPLFLQFKEAKPSVLAPHAPESQYPHNGERVVRGQRLMQASSDILLGWTQALSLHGVRDLYVRQLWDWKISGDQESNSVPSMRAYAEACGWTLARAHARSGDRVAIATYLGAKPVFDSALAEFAELYADQNERDYEALLAAVKSRRVVASADLYD